MVVLQDILRGLLKPFDPVQKKKIILKHFKFTQQKAPTVVDLQSVSHFGHIASYKGKVLHPDNIITAIQTQKGLICPLCFPQPKYLTCSYIWYICCNNNGTEFLNLQHTNRLVINAKQIRNESTYYLLCYSYLLPKN